MCTCMDVCVLCRYGAVWTDVCVVHWSAVCCVLCAAVCGRDVRRVLRSAVRVNERGVYLSSTSRRLSHYHTTTTTLSLTLTAYIRIHTSTTQRHDIFTIHTHTFQPAIHSICHYHRHTDQLPLTAHCRTGHTDPIDR